MVKVSLECTFPGVIDKDGVGFNPLAQIASARNCSIRFNLDRFLYRLHLHCFCQRSLAFIESRVDSRAVTRSGTWC
jgi:hypothetical protein